MNVKTQEIECLECGLKFIILIDFELEDLDCPNCSSFNLEVSKEDFNVIPE